MLAAELTHHLATEAASEGPGNHCNGNSPKTVLPPPRALDLAIPRDRLSTFDPQLVAKHQRRLPGFDDHVIGMYARGMTVREIQGHLTELYGLDVSPDLISTITISTITDEVWPRRRNGRPGRSTPCNPSSISMPCGSRCATRARSGTRRSIWPAQVIPFFAYPPPEVRKIIYTTNAIERLHLRLRKIVKTRGHFPNDAAATKLLTWPCATS